MLNIDDITVSYGDLRALRNVSMTVEKGSLTVLLGPNGAGKTTLLKTISGILDPDSGSITLDGDDLVTLPAHEIPRHGIAHVPEGSRVFTEMTVADNLMMGGQLRGADSEEGLEWVFDLFPVLEERQEQVASTLSGGEQQMLAIGRGLMLDPDLLMLDEPSLGLAPSIVDDVFNMIERLHEEDITILLVEQNASRALELADYGYVLESSRLATEGAAADLREEEDVKRAYLGQ